MRRRQQLWPNLGCVFVYVLVFVCLFRTGLLFCIASPESGLQYKPPRMSFSLSGLFGGPAVLCFIRTVPCTLRSPTHFDAVRLVKPNTDTPHTGSQEPCSASSSSSWPWPSRPPPSFRVSMACCHRTRFGPRAIVSGPAEPFACKHTHPTTPTHPEIHPSTHLHTH